MENIFIERLEKMLSYPYFVSFAPISFYWRSFNIYVSETPFDEPLKEKYMTRNIKTKIKEYLRKYVVKNETTILKIQNLIDDPRYKDTKELRNFELDLSDAIRSKKLAEHWIRDLNAPKKKQYQQK